MTVHALLAAAMLVPVISLVSVGVAKRLGRWLGAAMRREFSEAVKAEVRPQIEALSVQLEAVQAQNTKDHGEVVVELGALTTRVGDVEHRLANVEVAIAVQSRTGQE